MKTILITGASGDIAAALISSLNPRENRIIGLDRQPSAAARDIELHLCDLSDPAQLGDCLKRAREEWLADVEAVVHLAGVYPNLPLGSYPPELWEKVHAVNVDSLFRIVQAILACETTSLRNIVITSSTAAKSGSRDPAYASSKAALLGLAKSFSVSLAERRIRVNTVLPGIIETSMSDVQSPERKQFHIQRTLAKTIGTPEEVANVIDFLLSDKSSYLWGTTIEVNGGMT
ncbi:SDR family NAD(P)-dependent oxidoreductase [Cohnella algarum]|uniref:SDR family NAD(P)-dependent oxidoreductase n=1 Tax=Cohnella algarum TaxID=2044859 RepID=UPI001967FEFA|nr:SDR family oxidoreductase [Cohnella algarum]MBN2982513.1 SDR family oxidoreductase [Cohnella algarum]